MAVEEVKSATLTDAKRRGHATLGRTRPPGEALGSIRRQSGGSTLTRAFLVVSTGRNGEAEQAGPDWLV